MSVSQEFMDSALSGLDAQPEALPATTVSPDFLDAVIEPAGPAYVDKAPARRASLASATGVNPDQYARARALGARYGLPPTLVENHLDELEQRALLEDTDTLANDAPGLASALEDPEFAKLAHDEIEPLGMIERGLRALPAGLFNLSAGIYGLGETAGELISLATGPVARAGLLPEDPGQRIAQGFRGIRQGQQAMAKSVAGDRSDAGFVEQAVYSGIESISMNAPGVLGAIMTGQPAFALGPMVASTGGQGITQSLDKGVPVQQAIVRGASDAVVEYAFERTPLLTLLKNVDAGAPFMKTLLTNLAQEIPAEQVTTVLQDLNEWAVDNPDKPFASYIEERPSAAASTLISTIVGSGGQTAIVQGAATVAKTMDKRRQQADAATAHAEALAKISAQAAAVALKTRDPAMFRQAVEKMAAGSPDLYIDGSVLMQEFEGADETKAAILAAMPTVAAQLAEAGPTNGVVRVPVAEFLAAAPGTGIDEAMLPHLRTAPDGPSAADAEVFYQQEAEQTKAEAEKVMAQMQGDEIFIASAQAVEDTLLAELESAGRFTTDINKTYAALARDFYVTTAARTGVTPEQVYQQYPLRVNSAVASGEKLDQNAPDTPEFKTWFGNSTVRDESGAPLVMYHGTYGAGFDTFDPNINDRGAVFFTPEREVAEDYSLDAPIMEVYIRAENPFDSSNPEHVDALVEAIKDRAWVQNIGEESAKQLIASGDWQDIESSFDAIKALGFDAAYVVENDVRNIAVFDPTQIKSATGNRGTFDANDPNILKQKEEDIPPRGTFNIETNTISLLDRVNLTTFVHELGHFQLEVLASIAGQPNAPAQIVDDMNKLLAWFGVKDLDTWNAMPLNAKRPSHEKLARGMEFYLFEGKAPSVELQPVFARIKNWMLRAYVTMREAAGLTKDQQAALVQQRLRVTLTDEVRGVFDRLYASDQAITEAEQALALTPLFATREDFPGTDEEWAAYKDTTDAAHEDAASNLQSRSLRDMQWTLNYRMRMLKKAQKDAKAKRAQVQAEVEAEVSAERVYAVQRFIRGDSSAAGSLIARTKEQQALIDASGLSGTRLSLPILKTMYGEDEKSIPLWRDLPTGKNGLVAKEGSDPEIVAKLFGYTSADHMVVDISTADPFADKVENLTDRRMLERYGDLSSPEAIERAVNEAIHNTVHTRAIATELAALEKGAGPKRDMTALLKRLVKQSMLGRTIGNIRPAQHVAAEARAGREAQSARRTGRTKDVINAKRQQLWHNLSAIEARRVEAEIERSLKYLRKFNKTKVDGLRPDYLAQIQGILERYDLHKSTTQDQIGRRKELLKWLDEVEQETGVRPAVPESVENEALRQPYRQMTLEDFRGLLDTIRQLDHVGRNEQKLLMAHQKQALNETAAAFKASADANAPRVVATRLENVRFRDRFRTAVSKFLAGHQKLSSQMRELDGFQDNGVALNTIVRGANDASANEGKRMAATEKALHGLLTPLMKRVGFFDMVTPKVVPGAVGANGEPLSLSYMARIAVVLNMGNAVNYQRMRDGDGWTDATMEAILNTMTKEDMDFVQGVWDHFETYKPDLEAQELAIRGVKPKWVEAQELITPHGKYRGGYMPIMFDSNRDTRAKEFADIVDLSAMLAGARGRQTTPRGFLEARAKGDVAIPVRKDFGVIFNHVTAVNHRLAWENYVLDTQKLLKHPDVKTTIQKHLGVDAYAQIQNLRTEAALGRAPNTYPLDGLFGFLNNNASVAAMAWSMQTAGTQLIGVNQSIIRLGGAKDGGYKWFASGMRDFYGGADFRVKLEQIRQKSDFMRERAKNLDQNIRHLRQKLEMPGAVLKVKDTFFVPMLTLQTSVDGPTWMGAYNKAVADKAEGGLALVEVDAVAFADQVVRDAQGSGSVTDLSAVQRGSNIYGLFTRFYSYANTTLQLNLDVLRRRKMTPKDYAYAVHDLVLINVVPAIMLAAFSAFVVGDDDDEENFLLTVGKELGAGLMNQFVGLREFSGFVKGFDDYTGPAGVRVIQTGYKLGEQVIQGENDIQLWKQIVNTLGLATGLVPSAQVNRTIEGAKALSEDETDNPAVLLFGPPR